MKNPSLQSDDIGRVCSSFSLAGCWASSGVSSWDGCQGDKVMASCPIHTVEDWGFELGIFPTSQSETTLTIYVALWPDLQRGGEDYEGIAFALRFSSADLLPLSALACSMYMWGQGRDTFTFMCSHEASLHIWLRINEVGLIALWLCMEFYSGVWQG